jgi:hypothetical protein
MNHLAARLASLSPEKRRLLALQLRQQGVDVTKLPIMPQSMERRAFPLSLPQQRLWFLEQWAPATPVYNLPRALRLTGRLSIAALQHSLQHIIRRHAVLRSTFTTVDGQPLQVISPPRDVPLAMVDLQDVPATARQTEVLRLCAEAARRPFDLTQGPLLRLTLFRLGPDEHVLRRWLVNGDSHARGHGPL